jgi:hypothetical protein
MGVSANPAAVIKAFTYLEDVDEDGGATTIVPGSHVLTFDPRDAFTMTRDGAAVGGVGGVSGPPAKGEEWADRPLEDDWTANVYQVQPQSAMVGAHKLVCDAGDVCLFDTSIWHTARCWRHRRPPPNDAAITALPHCNDGASPPSPDDGATTLTPSGTPPARTTATATARTQSSPTAAPR